MHIPSVSTECPTKFLENFPLTLTLQLSKIDTNTSPRFGVGDGERATPSSILGVSPIWRTIEGAATPQRDEFTHISSLTRSSGQRSH